MDDYNAEKQPTFFRFEDLRVYDKSLLYVSWVQETTGNLEVLPNNNIYYKFNEASRAITMNISEGSARNKSQFIYYLKMAKSSVRECLVYTTILSTNETITRVQEDESRNYLMELTKMIGALISSLQRSSSGGRDSYDDSHDDYPHDKRMIDGPSY